MWNPVSKRAAIVASVLAVTLGLAGGAYAVFSATGAGGGSVLTGSGANITLTQTSSVAGMIPGGAAVILRGTATNSSSGDLFVGVVTPSFASSSCGLSASDFTFSPSADNNYQLAANTTSPTLDFGSVQMNDLASSQAQGCSFSIRYTL